jgi:hypothetical protein
MDYHKIYLDIINKARSLEESRIGNLILEKHHIIPKSIGGSNKKENLVRLTPKEHFICHRLLCKIYPESDSLRFAFWAMCNQLSGDAPRDYKVSSRTYNDAKSMFSKVNSKLHKGKKLSPEHIEIIRKNFTGENNHNFGVKGEAHYLYNKPIDFNTRKKISETKIKNPKGNGMYKGDYITPFGTFSSSQQAVKYIKERFGISLYYQTLQSRCKDNLRIITRLCGSNINGLHPDNDIPSYLGKTFKDLGWEFRPR